MVQNSFMHLFHLAGEVRAFNMGLNGLSSIHCFYSKNCWANLICLLLKYWELIEVWNLVVTILFRRMGSIFS